MTTSLERDSTSLERDTQYKEAFSEADDHWPLRPWVAGTPGMAVVVVVVVLVVVVVVVAPNKGRGPRQGAGQGRMSEKGQYFCHRLALWEMLR